MGYILLMVLLPPFLIGLALGYGLAMTQEKRRLHRPMPLIDGDSRANQVIAWWCVQIAQGRDPDEAATSLQRLMGSERQQVLHDLAARLPALLPADSLTIMNVLIGHLIALEVPSKADENKIIKKEVQT